MRLAEVRTPGPPPSYNHAQFLLAFLTIGGSGTIGRTALAKRAGLGEGAVRTVLKKLRTSGFAEVNASGCHLTASGVGVYGSLKRRLSGPLIVNSKEISLDKSQVALLIRGGGRRVKRGIEQRDSAVKAGASGAVTYTVKGGKFTMPDGSLDCERDFPSPVWNDLREELRPRDDDAVILCGSSDETTATLGALSAALTLI